MTASSRNSFPSVSPTGPSKSHGFIRIRGKRAEHVKQKTVTENGDKGKSAQKSQQANAPDKENDQDDTHNDPPTPRKPLTRNSNNSRSRRRRLEPEDIDTIDEASSLKPSKGSSSENPCVFDSSPSKRNSNNSAAVARKRRRTSSRSAAQEKVAIATQKHANAEEEEKDEEDVGEQFEVEAIMGHKAYRSMVVKYEIKWLGYSEKNNTWEPATSVHEDCPELCASYWSKHEERPKNIPTATSIAKEQEQKKSEPSKPEDKYLKRLEENNITNDDLHESLRNQGFKIAYGTGFPEATTDWALEMRQIHLVQRVVGTDQILAYVSWVNRKKTVHAVQELHDHCPGELISYYEARVRFVD
ncbi:hypothetical protein BDB00DRAFT_10805 [Zychaea mexicana]|uniref:uncharacterized protein n=1 Tax=Zychaea mexicana TaxID=64656 RepID=UPI0022FF3658|nr:uncharacterized protein BDB00DRAFT_10805 [Zychaea mexicana]KAI9499648.1 hypothetical protein BDB00DRAFT_10805 [Zychaea mexicana]